MQTFPVTVGDRMREDTSSSKQQHLDESDVDWACVSETHLNTSRWTLSEEGTLWTPMKPQKGKRKTKQMKPSDSSRFLCANSSLYKGPDLLLTINEDFLFSCFLLMYFICLVCPDHTPGCKFLAVFSEKLVFKVILCVCVIKRSILYVNHLFFCTYTSSPTFFFFLFYQCCCCLSSHFMMFFAVGGCSTTVDDGHWY